MFGRRQSWSASHRRTQRLVEGEPLQEDLFRRVLQEPMVEIVAALSMSSLYRPSFTAGLSTSSIYSEPICILTALLSPCVCELFLAISAPVVAMRVSLFSAHPEGCNAALVAHVAVGGEWVPHQLSTPGVGWSGEEARRDWEEAKEGD